MNRTNLAIKEEYVVETETEVDSQKLGIEEIKKEELKENNHAEDFEKKKVSMVYLVSKKVIDIIAGIIGTILLLPVTIIVWIVRILKHENDGPLFFEQLRIGKNGKQFRMYKFRTIYGRTKVDFLELFFK